MHSFLAPVQDCRTPSFSKWSHGDDPTCSRLALLARRCFCGPVETVDSRKRFFVEYVGGNVMAAESEVVSEWVRRSTRCNTNTARTTDRMTAVFQYEHLIIVSVHLPPIRLLNLAPDPVRQPPFYAPPSYSPLPVLYNYYCSIIVVLYSIGLDWILSYCIVLRSIKFRCNLSYCIVKVAPWAQWAMGKLTWNTINKRKTKTLYTYMG